MKIGSGLKAINTDHHAISWDHEGISEAFLWRTGVIVALILFALQAVYFETPYLFRNTLIRTKLEKACQFLGCQLPAYQNANKLDILQTSFSRRPDGSYLVRVVTKNSAAFAQPFPNLKLTLRDYSGNPFGTRLFTPQDYLLPYLMTISDIPADTSLEINLNIVEPEIKLGGYTFELVY